jgi:hypothetical protein
MRTPKANLCFQTASHIIPLVSLPLRSLITTVSVLIQIKSNWVKVDILAFVLPPWPGAQSVVSGLASVVDSKIRQ